MQTIVFHIHFCGHNAETYTQQIMIYKPHHTLSKSFTYTELSAQHITGISDLIRHIKNDPSIASHLGEWGMDFFDVDTIYLRYEHYLLGLKTDKDLEQIFNDLHTDELEIVLFIVGGASLHCETNYRFTVHSDEKIHAHMPHVHVSKAEVEVRYSLDTLLPIDPMVNPHKRDYKKVIRPFLEQHQQELLTMWKQNLNDYTTPTITEDDRQYYSVS